METDRAEIAVGSVKDKLNRLLSQEAHLLKGVWQDVSIIKDELQSSHALLKYAANTSMEGEDKTWPEELKEVALQIELLIDKYTFKIAQLLEIAHPFIRFRAAHQIANIKSRLSEIKKKAEKQHYDSGSTDHEYFTALDQKSSTTATSASSSTSWWEDPQMNPLYLKKPPPEAFVGSDAPVQKLASLLLDKTSPIRTVVAVVGKAGLGKTTLARKVYDEVKTKFDCYAWITLTQPYTTEELLRKLINNFHHNRWAEYVQREEFNITNMDSRAFQRTLRSYLLQNRYFVVLLGVWEIDFLSDIVEHALIDYNNGSRIMITTRHEKFEDFCKRSSSLVHVYELQPFSYGMALELFFYKVFRYDFDYVPGTSKQHKIYKDMMPRLLSTCSRIVVMCQGLPLAISVVAGFVSTKKDNLQELKKHLESLKLDIRPTPQLPSPMQHILNLCFNDLPYHLKSCFLYFGVFPKGYSVRCSSLFRQWIAEGFVISTEKHKTLEAVAREYLIQLARRGLVELSMTWSRGAKSCSVHSIVHEFIVLKMDELHFCQQVMPENGLDNTSNNQLITRRLSFVKMTSINNGALGSNRSNNSGIRGIFIFNKEDGFPTSKIHSFTRRFKLLTVLIFDNAPIDHLPEDLGDLFHLRYLSMRYTKVKKLPKSIGKLQNLETLDLRETQVSNIPKEINRLPKLKYLLVYPCDPSNHRSLSRTTGVGVQKGIGGLKTLHKLYYINVIDDDMLKELGNLTNLRKLGILNVRKEKGNTLCASIEKMVHLESLHIAMSEDHIIALEGIKSAPQFLRHLHLQGRLKRLPKWITKLQNLVKIEIFHSKLKHVQLEVLQNLRYLSELQISSDAYDGEVLHLDKGCFPKLILLKLKYLSSLKLLTIGKGAMPCLEELHIGPCDQLKFAPNGIQYLDTLKRLEFYNLEIEILRSMHNELKSYKKLRIPNVYFHYQIEGGSFTTLTFQRSDQDEEHLQVQQPSGLQVKPEVASSSGHEDSKPVEIPEPPSPPVKTDINNRLKEIQVIAPPLIQNRM